MQDWDYKDETILNTGELSGPENVGNLGSDVPGIMGLQKHEEHPASITP